MIMLDKLSKKILLEVNLNKKESEIREYSPLVLAYIGDAVHELFVRTLILSEKSGPVCILHRLATGYVKAKAQSNAIHKIFDVLTQDEQDIVRRGRNAKPSTMPKNADIIEYKYATGFEALLGYLYLNQKYDRMMQIIRLSIKD
jgi:ribonuclease-3 family protein